MRAAGATAVAALLLSGAALTPRAEAAPAVTALPHARVLNAGASARFGVELRDTGVRSCQLKLARRGSRPKRSRAVATTTRSLLTWTWTVPRSARSLAWRADVTCRMSSGARVTVSRRVRVRASSRVSASFRRAVIVTGRFRARRHGQALSAPSPGLNPYPTAPTPVPTTTVPTTAPSTGESTDWALWQRRFDLGPVMGGPVYIYAADWDERARAYGFPVDKLPRVGDIAVWERGFGGDIDGHVAYVESFDVEAGTGTVSEMDYAGDYALTRGRVLYQYDIQSASFIHHK